MPYDPVLGLTLLQHCILSKYEDVPDAFRVHVDAADAADAADATIAARAVDIIVRRRHLDLFEEHLLKFNSGTHPFYRWVQSRVRPGMQSMQSMQSTPAAHVPFAGMVTLNITGIKCEIGTYQTFPNYIVRCGDYAMGINSYVFAEKPDFEELTKRILDFCSMIRLCGSKIHMSAFLARRADKDQNYHNYDTSKDLYKFFCVLILFIERFDCDKLLARVQIAYDHNRAPCVAIGAQLFTPQGAIDAILMDWPKCAMRMAPAYTHIR